MREIKTDIRINATSSKVWSVLADFEKYPSWNPFIVDAKGVIEEGKHLKVRISPPGGKPMAFKPIVQRVLPERELRWLGRLWIPGLFDGEHVFEINEVGDEGIVFVQREQFRGILVPFLWQSLNTKTRKGFEQMNEALKRQSEDSLKEEGSSDAVHHPLPETTNHVRI